jgi:hypothetical protein
VRYALAHPERCYHLLFDARGTAAVAAPFWPQPVAFQLSARSRATRGMMLHARLPR